MEGARGRGSVGRGSAQASQEARAALREYDTAQAVDLWAVVGARGHPPAEAALVAGWEGEAEA